MAPRCWGAGARSQPTHPLRLSPVCAHPLRLSALQLGAGRPNPIPKKPRGGSSAGPALLVLAPAEPSTFVSARGFLFLSAASRCFCARGRRGLALSREHKGRRGDKRLRTGPCDIWSQGFAGWDGGARGSALAGPPWVSSCEACTDGTAVSSTGAPPGRRYAACGWGN